MINIVLASWAANAAHAHVQRSRKLQSHRIQRHCITLSLGNMWNIAVSFSSVWFQDERRGSRMWHEGQIHVSLAAKHCLGWCVFGLSGRRPSDDLALCYKSVWLKQTFRVSWEICDEHSIVSVWTLWTEHAPLSHMRRFLLLVRWIHRGGAVTLRHSLLLHRPLTAVKSWGAEFHLMAEVHQFKASIWNVVWNKL